MTCILQYYECVVTHTLFPLEIVYFNRYQHEVCHSCSEGVRMAIQLQVIQIITCILHRCSLDLGILMLASVIIRFLRHKDLHPMERFLPENTVFHLTFQVTVEISRCNIWTTITRIKVLSP